MDPATPHTWVQHEVGWGWDWGEVKWCGEGMVSVMIVADKKGREEIDGRVVHLEPRFWKMLKRRWHGDPFPVGSVTHMYI